MANKISDETIEYVGILAKLELSEKEKEEAKADMEKMLDYIDVLNELDTDGIEPMSHVFPVNNVFREDVVTNGDGSSDTLANAPLMKDTRASRCRRQSDRRRRVMDIMSLTAVELGKKIKAKEISVTEATQAYLDQIEKVENDVHSYVTIDKEGALKRAEEVQKMIDDGTLLSPLAGVPVAIKDNMCTKGTRTTCSSKILENFVPTFTSEAVLNLEKAGAVIIGKTNMDEFAMGSTTETSYYGVTRNPWNLGHVPGGSSGGSCAAVAAGECAYALGSDTGEILSVSRVHFVV